MIFHRAIERLRGMTAGAPVTHEQLSQLLGLTNDLHSKDAKHHYEATHLSGASDEHATVIIEQHRVGPGEDTLAPEPRLNDRSQKSWAQYIKSGNLRVKNHQLTEGNNYGVVRPATASGDSVEDDPSYVPVTDDENDAAFNVYMPSYQPFEDGDRVMYVLQKDGTAWTFGGGTGAQLRKALANSNWVDDTTPYVDVTDTESGATVRVYLPRTMPGDPNIRGGATLYYMIANDGVPICMTPYMDDKIGVLKYFNADGDEPVAGWQHHEASAGKIMPNYLPGDEDYPTTGAAGGTKDHDHEPHSLTMSTVTVVSGATFDSETCELSTTTCQICFIGQGCV